MKREIRKTADGSVTIHLPEWNEQYHSIHGAIQEAQHVFLQAGLHFQLERTSKKELSILELGFGTGLNAWLTLLEANTLKVEIAYTTLEAYPVLASEVADLNYPEHLEQERAPFEQLHESKWNELITISNYFDLEKRQQFFDEVDEVEKYNLIYFDAFGARVQPELWTEQIFQKMYVALKNEGVLVT
ncbi:MAG: tRNA (5-methylaminomethyl-2-thiouridine)(34)-methyltransferase MnmD, partial [Flavobacteriaceae bacterium]|nr:tRNA (5-methylaminomethyl-2-thiouridine)(34)-methyltransferase MnmD [Flavobacteriaceae bacterium]